jgi:hypothetical protein
VGVSAINYCPPNPNDGDPYSCPNPAGAPMTFDAVKAWRTVHFPITLAFGVLAVAHIGIIFLFWGWK